MAFVFENKNWGVVGFGVSGQSAARLLLKKGARVFLFDEKLSTDFPPDLVKEFQSKNCQVCFQPFNEKTFLHVDGLIISPGVPLAHPVLQSLIGKKIMIGETEFAAEFIDQQKVIGVTGTDGKSTTTTLIGHFLQQKGRRVFVGGNLGKPLSKCVLDGDDVDAIVLELSSFQLEMAKNLHPHIAVILNLSADHLDRYETYEAYARAKGNIFNQMTAKDTLILNAHHSMTPTFQEWAKPTHCVVNTFSPVGLGIPEFPNLPGEHNKENIAAALCAVEAFLQTRIRPTLTEWQGLLEGYLPLPYRLALVGQSAGVSFYNDSKATTLQATAAALRAFRKNVVWIVGGYKEIIAPAMEKKRQEALGVLHQLIEDGKVRCIVAQGENREEWISLFSNKVPIFETPLLGNALKVVGNQMRPGDIVLFSPASKSFDQFKNYQERGQVFDAWVQSLKSPS